MMIGQVLPSEQCVLIYQILMVLSIIWGTSYGRPCCAHSKGMEQIDMGIYSQTSGGHFKILIPRGQIPFYICRL